MMDVEARIKEVWRDLGENDFRPIRELENLARELAAELNAATSRRSRTILEDERMIDVEDMLNAAWSESARDEIPVQIQKLTLEVAAERNAANARADLAEARIAAMLEAAEPGNPPVDSDGTAICGLYETEEWYITDGIHARLKAIAEATE